MITNEWWLSVSHFAIEKNFSDSQYHFLFTSDGQQCAAMLVESATTQGFPGEADLFVAQAVLQYVPLCFISLSFVWSLQCLMSIQLLEDSLFWVAIQINRQSVVKDPRWWLCRSNGWNLSVYMFSLPFYQSQRKLLRTHCHVTSFIIQHIVTTSKMIMTLSILVEYTQKIFFYGEKWQFSKLFYHKVSQLCFSISVLKNKTIFLLNLAEYHLI